MTGPPTDELIASLAAKAAPVRPLASPLRRAGLTLALLLAAGAALVLLWGDSAALARRYAGRETLMMVEMGAMVLTAASAVTAAFVLSIPGGSRRWMLAPLAPFAAWIGLSGVGCLGTAGIGALHSADCLLFILGASLAVGTPLLWRLARARPIDPLPVALTGGLGAAALAALLLQFFHPFAVTFVDLGVHLTAVLLVVAVVTVARRRLLAPA
jgi:hypothetical protein